MAKYKNFINSVKSANKIQLLKQNNESKIDSVKAPKQQDQKKISFNQSVKQISPNKKKFVVNKNQYICNKLASYISNIKEQNGMSAGGATYSTDITDQRKIIAQSLDPRKYTLNQGLSSSNQNTNTLYSLQGQAA